VATLIGPAAEYASEASHFSFEPPIELLYGFPIGIFATVIASIAWARLVDGTARKRAATWFFFAPIGINVGASWIEPINVHGPGMLLVLATIVWWLLALVLIILSAWWTPPPASVTADDH
jgi:hypothetical protein